MRFKIDIENDLEIKNAVSEAVSVLEEGGILLYPTDTVYGLGADFENRTSYKRLRNLKHKDEKDKLSIIVRDINMAKEYAIFDERAIALASAFWPGRLTLVLNAKDGGTIGVRVPDNKFCATLLEKFGKPIFSTSANISGRDTEKSVDDILNQFGDSVEKIDLIIDQGILPESKPSTVVDVTSKDIKILRKGDISLEMIEGILSTHIGIDNRCRF